MPANQPIFSVIVPVYNRPHEIDELLQSLTTQRFGDFEVLIVEDGSTDRCEAIVDQFRSRLRITYFYKPNSGPGPSRNFGFSHARGEYLVVFDSDCIIPPGYFEAVKNALANGHVDAWGGPDKASEKFTPLQQAMGYTMSSVLTTGGIRGGKKHFGWFQPRSFNMGISRAVFEKTGGFAFDRFAEDIEFSIRMKHQGFRVVLIPEAYVYHKRRSTLRDFFRQVSNFGKGRVLVGEKFPSEVKLTHWFPALFTLGCLSMPLLYVLFPPLFIMAAWGLALYLALIFIHGTLTMRNLLVGFMAVPTALIQLWGYGTGFLTQSFIRRFG